MKRLLNARFLNVGLFLIGVSIWCSVNGSPAFAFSATITTSNSIDLEVSSVGDGVSIHSIPINITSDCRSGYNLSVATPSGSDLYKYDNGVQSGNTAVFTAVDGVTSLGSGDNANKWGYALASDADKNTTFLPLSVNGSVIKDVSETASADSDIDDTFSIKYGVKVDNSVESGNYRMAGDGAIVYYLTMDTTCTQYTVLFDPNGGTVADGGNNPTQNIQLGEPTKLASSDALKAPVGASYIDSGNNTINGQADKLWTFWGWNTEIDGSGDWYKEREPVEDLAEATQTFTLYAQWKQATLADLTTGTQVGDEKVIDHNTMQDMSPETCYNSDITTAANAPAVTLLDYRGKVTTGNNPESPEQYNVSKLPDGTCWMTTNLNLGRTGSDGPNGDGTITLTPDDTDLVSGTTFVLPASTTTSSSVVTAPRIRTTNNSGTNTNGDYYSWAASVATSTPITVLGNVTTSICPKNWDLPVGDHFTNLRTKANYKSGNLTTSAPSSFLTNGGFTNGANFYQTGYSHFWTSTVNNTSTAFGARVNGTTMTVSAAGNTTYGGNKYYEKSIRCIASKGKVSITYNGNGNDSGSVSNQENVEINSTNTADNGFSRSGYGFTGWNTQADGSGVNAIAGSVISDFNPQPGSSITLFAQWVPQYKITYVNNCLTYVNDSSCTQEVSSRTGEQTINLDGNGDGSGTLAEYNGNSWTITGWKIADWSTVANNSNSSGSSYQTGGTYAVTGQNAGDGVTLYAHWVPVYSIQYDGNGADNPNGMGTINANTGIKSIRQINVGQGDQVMLLANNFKRATYGFAGWSTDPDAWGHFTDNDNTNDPIIYGPMETLSAPSYPAGSIMTLYAVWVPAEKDSNDNPIYFQEWDDPVDNADGCASLNSTVFDDSVTDEKSKIIVNKNSVIALTDKRDNEVYAVARLADGNCWMMENMRLNNAYTMGQNQNDNTVSNQSLAQGYGGTVGVYGSFVGLAPSELANYINTTTANGVYKSSANPPVDIYDPSNTVLEDIGTKDSPGYRMPRYNNNNTNSMADSTSYTQNYGNEGSPTDSGTNFRTSSNVYGYGNYYTWAAALANTNYYTSLTGSESANTSICPAGWHLPSSGSSNKEYGELSRGYDGSGEVQSGVSQSGDIISNRVRSFPNNLLLSGNTASSSISNRGGTGYYWSRSAYSKTNSYRVGLNPITFNPSNNSSKAVGYSIRCLISP